MGISQLVMQSARLLYKGGELTVKYSSRVRASVRVRVDR